MAKALHAFALPSASKVLTASPTLHAFLKAFSARVDELPHIAASPTINAVDFRRAAAARTADGLIFLPPFRALQTN